jgi:hypothetical protein
VWINFGVERVVLIGYGVLLGIGALNLVLVVLDRPGVGLWVQTWARRYFVLAALLAFFVGAVIGHFFLATPPSCPKPSAQSLAAAAYPQCQAVTTRAPGR